MNNRPKEPTIFPDGMMIKKPREGAPKFVKGSISVNVKNFQNFMNKFPKSEWLNFDILTSKENKLYLKLNTFGMEGIIRDTPPQNEITADDVAW